MYYCYILKSLINSNYYIGSTANLQKRLEMHNTKKVKSTTHNVPWQIVYYEAFRTLSGARKRESQIKRWKSRAAIERLINKI
ncbi:MAG: GIY-YIG nuclease family protein [Candidatus Doudnabacteria bacterium]|nr:GIY-YIG nuclease family protein [Candidatus Doudnabacteria bacterium]